MDKVALNVLMSRPGIESLYSIHATLRFTLVSATAYKP